MPQTYVMGHNLSAIDSIKMRFIQHGRLYQIKRNKKYNKCVLLSQNYLIRFILKALSNRRVGGCKNLLSLFFYFLTSQGAFLAKVCSQLQLLKKYAVKFNLLN